MTDTDSPDQWIYWRFQILGKKYVLSSYVSPSQLAIWCNIKERIHTNRAYHLFNSLTHGKTVHISRYVINAKYFQIKRQWKFWEKNIFSWKDIYSIHPEEDSYYLQDISQFKPFLHLDLEKNDDCVVLALAMQLAKGKRDPQALPGKVRHKIAIHSFMLSISGWMFFCVLYISNMIFASDYFDYIPFGSISLSFLIYFIWNSLGSCCICENGIIISRLFYDKIIPYSDIKSFKLNGGFNFISPFKSSTYASYLGIILITNSYNKWCLNLSKSQLEPNLSSAVQILSRHHKNKMNQQISKETFSYWCNSVALSENGILILSSTKSVPYIYESYEWISLDTENTEITTTLIIKDRNDKCIKKIEFSSPNFYPGYSLLHNKVSG